jgi:DNA-binding NarL/FixJ family response regulator
VLLQRAVAAVDRGDARELLEEFLASALFLLGRYERAQNVARQVMLATAVPDRRGRMAWTAAYSLLHENRPRLALAVVDQALGDLAGSGPWAARLTAIRALALLNDGGGGETAATAQAALAAAERTGDRFAGGYALHILATLEAIAGDAAAAIALAEQALDLIGDDPETTDLRLLLMNNRRAMLFELGCDTGKQARELVALAERVGTARIGALRWSLGQYLFDTGRWDDALAELAPVLGSETETSDMSLLGCRGLAALIAAYRDDQAALRPHLDDAGPLPNLAGIDHVFVADLGRARATALELTGNPGEAAAIWAQAMDPDYVTYPEVKAFWLNSMARCALAAADVTGARMAALQCAETAVGHDGPLVAAAAAQARGLVDGDPEPAAAAVTAYRQAGRPLELGQALEDLAVVEGATGHLTAARAALREAVEIYTGLGANGPIRRADARARAHGVRRGRSGSRRPATGWDALTPTEVKIACLVSEGLSNPDIGTRLFMSWHTVKVHVSRIMAKLDVRSRVEIARVAGQHVATPQAPAISRPA